jgi:hypothetical protein
MPGTMWYHNHTTIPDMGREQPEFYRFRYPLLSLLVTLIGCKLKSRDGAYIEFEDNRTTICAGELATVEMKLMSGLRWFRGSDYVWRGVEISDEVPLIESLCKRFLPWFYWRRWQKEKNLLDIVYQYRFDEARGLWRKEPIEWQGISGIQIVEKIKSTQHRPWCIAVCCGFAGKYTHKEGTKWTDNSFERTESYVVDRLEECVSNYHNWQDDYNQARKDLEGLDSSLAITWRIPLNRV